MLANTFVGSARVMSNGQIILPKDIQEILGVSSGDSIVFISEGNTVRIVNSALYAMQVLQKEMDGEAEGAGLISDDDVMALVKELRNEDEDVIVRQLTKSMEKSDMGDTTLANIVSKRMREKYVDIK